MLSGKKTYILAGLGLLAGACLYAQGVIQNGFSFDGLLKFVNSEVVLGALATLRLSISKKG